MNFPFFDSSASPVLFYNRIFQAFISQNRDKYMYVEEENKKTQYKSRNKKHRTYVHMKEKMKGKV